jgi:hypothetical protein
MLEKNQRDRKSAKEILDELNVSFKMNRKIKVFIF